MKIYFLGHPVFVDAAPTETWELDNSHIRKFHAQINTLTRHSRDAEFPVNLTQLDSWITERSSSFDLPDVVDVGRLPLLIRYGFKIPYGTVEYIEQ